MGIICSAVSQGIRLEIIEKDTSSEMWDRLKEKFDIASSVQSFEGLQTAITTQFDSCRNVQDYAQRLSTALVLYNTIQLSGDTDYPLSTHTLPKTSTTPQERRYSWRN